MRWDEDHESEVAKVEKPLQTTWEVVVNHLKRRRNTSKMIVNSGSFTGQYLMLLSRILHQVSMVVCNADTLPF